MPYDYSQPVVIINNVNSNGGEDANAEAQRSVSEQQGLTAFDEGLQFFKEGKYEQALSRLSTSLKLLPNDPVVHEVRCLVLFATGDYNSAAAGLNSLLASAPGMDWTTLSGLYGNVDDYTAQLRKLERYVASKPTDPSSHFVLAYHYLVMGAEDEAIDALRIVTANQPKDVTARKMLDALAPAAVEQSAVAAPSPAPASTAQVAEESIPSLTTDLVGTWVATTGASKVELSITEDSQFTWKATQPNQAPVSLTGNLSGDAEQIELVTANSGTLGGTVQSKGPDSWLLIIAGAPKSDPGFEFKRVK